MHGLTPGPTLMQKNPEFVWGVIASMFIGTIVLVFMNMPMVPYIAKLLALPQRLLIPIIMCLAFMGTYMMNYSAFDFVLLVLFGLLGYSMQKLDVPIPPMVLGLILGSTLEKNFRMAMVEKSGSFSVFLDKPIALFFIALAALSLAYSVWQTVKAAAREQERANETPAA